jgi:glycine cleavage system transcriptional repressor
MTQRWIVTALGQDRPGIVAGVTKVLYQLGCNLEDSAMTRLEGEFTIMLIFSASARVSEGDLRKRFEPLARRLKLSIHLKRLSAKETAAPRKGGAVYRISVYGADRPGIVFRVSEALARIGVNITDVHTHRSAGGGRRAPSLYLVLLEAEVPPRLSVSSVEAQLKRIAQRLRVQLSLRPADTSVL